MFSFNLLNQWQKIAIVAITFLLLIVAVYLGAAIRIKQSTAGTNSACAKVVTSSGNEFGGYLDVSLASQMRSEVNATEETPTLVEMTSDIFLYPSNYIVAKGHAVTISGQTVAQAGPNAETTIWVDENDNNVINSGESITVPSSIASTIYIYGGSDSSVVNTDKISITMTGGEIGAIFAGGQYQNVTTKSVDIQITGGSVLYVDCGSQTNLYDGLLTASESISVLLKDCVYRSNFAINFISSGSYACSNVSVLDFSDHRDVLSYTRHTPRFNNYILKLEKNSYLFGGNVTIPEDRDISARVLVVKENTVVNNLGKVSTPHCQYINMLDGALWTGNPIQTAHVNVSTDHYTYSDHYLKCSSCHTMVCNAHVWTYSDNGDGTHDKLCGVCGYSYPQDCEMVDEYTNTEYYVRKTCKNCGHKDVITDNTASSVVSCGANHPRGASIYLNHQCADHYADGLDDDLISARPNICATCNRILPYRISSGRMFASLTELCNTANANVSALSVTMLCDALPNSEDEIIDFGGTITLDMAGYNIERNVKVKSCSLQIINSKSATRRYSRFTEQFEASAGATIDADHCYFEDIKVNGSSNATFIFKDVRCGVLTLNSTESLTLNNQVIVEKRLNNGIYSGSYLPAGYIIGEMNADGDWLSMYDHTNVNIPYTLGPIVNSYNPHKTTSYIALMPCDDHVFDSVTSRGVSGHSGTCLRCGRTVTVSHDMTSGQKYSTKQLYHQLKCSECSYAIANSKIYHDYDNDGKCLVCGESAVVAIRGSHSAKKKYLLNFDEAMDIAMSSLAPTDTITLFSDQTHTKTRRFMYDRFYINGVGYVGGGPRIFIEGNGHTLDNTGSIEFPAAMQYDTDDNGHHYYSFEASHDIMYAYSLYEKQTTIGKYKMLRPEKGYRASIVTGANNESYVKPEECSHQTGRAPSYVSRRKLFPIKEDGVPLDYHARVCQDCLDAIYQSHTFVNGVCSLSGCGVKQSDVRRVRVTGSCGGTRYDKFFSSLYDAWEWALPSIMRNGEFTIRLLADIDMYQEHPSQAWCLEQPNYPGSVILDAIDANGVEHSVKGWYNSSTGANSCIVKVNNVSDAQFTIKSGIYQAYRYAVETNVTNGSLKVEGGTFKNGINSSYKGLYNPNGIFNNVAEGCFIINGSNLYTRELNNSSLTSVSGTVIKCVHNTFARTEAKAPNCAIGGNPAYTHCSICGVYTNMETGEISVTEPKLPRITHEYSNNICTYCGLKRNGVTVERVPKFSYNLITGNQTLFSDFWSRVVYDAKQYSDMGYSYTLKLNSDVHTLEGEDVLLATIPDNCSVTIDLNGFCLDLGGIELPCGNNRLIIKDGSHSGKSVLTANINQPSVESDLTLDGVQLKTSNLYCNYLDMINGSGIIFEGGEEDNANIRFMILSMQDGCYMEGVGCSKFHILGYGNFDFEIDKYEHFVDLAHHLTIEQQNSNGEWISIPGIGRYVPTLDYVSSDNPYTVTTASGKTAASCYRWHAVKQQVEHELYGSWCSVCGLSTHHFLLHDKTEYNLIKKKTYLGTAYNRPFENGSVWEPLYIPMSIAPSAYAADCDIADIYSFGRMFDTNGDGKLDAGDDTWLIVDLMKSGATDPNYPYLIRPKEGVDGITFQSVDKAVYGSKAGSVSCGNSSETFVFQGSNSIDNEHIPTYSAAAVFMLDDEGKLSQTDATTVDPQRWYAYIYKVAGSAELRPSYSNGIRVMVMGEDISEETAIRLLKGETVEVNLDGQHYTLDGRKATTTESGLKIVNGKKVIVK